MGNTSTTDSELIYEFVTNKDRSAFDALLKRYYKSVYGMAFNATQNESDAHDICQTIWLKVLESLPRYEDHGKFHHFLNRLTKNTLIDLWKSKDFQARNTALELEEGHSTIPPYDVEAKIAVEYLTNELIPKLPCNMRLVFLLKHESEYWDKQNPLKLQNLAALNGWNIKIVDKLLKSATKKYHLTRKANKSAGMTCEEKVVYFVWDHSQRASKSVKFKDSELAELIGIPINTFKTHYRRATQTLQQGLQKVQ